MNLLDPYLQKIQDKNLRIALCEYLLHHWDKFSIWPASRGHHHSWRGGLLEHTIEVCDIGLKIIDALNLNIDIDNFLVAAILHDIGKIKEYYFENGKWEKRTDVDHSLFSVIEFKEVTGYALPIEVLHAIHSHMGGWSAIRYPQNVMEAVLHSADLISSKMELVDTDQ